MASPDPAPPPPSSPDPVPLAERWLPPALGLVVGLVVLGPGMGSGPLLNLDLAALPELRVPPGMWGLGPALTQRVPLGAMDAWIAVVLGGPLTVKVLIVVAVATAYAGMERLARPASAVARHGVALVYAAGPYTVTRAAIGHLNVLWAVAVLAWVLPTLLRPSAALRRTFVALFVLSLGGAASAVLGLTVVAIGLATEPRRRPARVAGVAVVASLPWLVPSVVVMVLGASVGGAGSFATEVHGLLGVGSVLAGGGFWVPLNQVGGEGPVAVVGGLALTGLAVLGFRSRPQGTRLGLVAVAVVGLVLALASAVPVASSVWDVVVASPIGAPLREGQRFLVLWLVVALPAAALGADRVAARLGTALQPAATAVPLALGLALAAPGAFGAEGAFRPRRIPAAWDAAAAAVADRPGTTLVLPWHLYYRASFADDRTILNPGPDVIGGDTISSFDPEVGGGQEQLDRRVRDASQILGRYRQGRPAADRLVELGVRWVFVPQESDWSVAGLAMADDPGLRPVPVGEGVLLYEVAGWHGPLRAPGQPDAGVPSMVAPLRSAPASGGLWAFPGTGGWLRGLTPVPVTRAGLLQVPAGSGPLWYWPAVPVLVGDATALAGLGWALRRSRRCAVAPALESERSMPMRTTVRPRRSGEEHRP